MIFVIGGAEFVGANFVLDWPAQTVEPVENIDKLTYSGNLNNLGGHTMRGTSSRTAILTTPSNSQKCWSIPARRNYPFRRRKPR